MSNPYGRYRENTRENFADFCCEVEQLLCRSWAITHEKFCNPTSGRFLRLLCICSKYFLLQRLMNLYQEFYCKNILFLR